MQYQLHLLQFSLLIILFTTAEQIYYKEIRHHQLFLHSCIPYLPLMTIHVRLFHQNYYNNPILKAIFIECPRYSLQCHDHQHKEGIPQRHINTFHMSILPTTSVQ